METVDVASLETVDVASLEMVRPRSAGVEHVGLWAMEQLGIGDLLCSPGFFNRRSRAVAMGSIIGRNGGAGARSVRPGAGSASGVRSANCSMSISRP